MRMIPVFDLVTRNFGPSEATPVQVSFDLVGGLIGPEGGFAAEEASAVERAG
jgi:16S rRNA U1498 N3-methylase RsmE